MHVHKHHNMNTNRQKRCFSSIRLCAGPLPDLIKDSLLPFILCGKCLALKCVFVTYLARNVYLLVIIFIQ